MTPSKPTGSTETVGPPTVGQETLDATPERAIKFLRGVGTVPAIRSALAACGYTQDEHDRGWKLLHGASGYGHEPDFASAVDPQVHSAIATLDAWDEDGFRIVRAALGRLHPEQAKTVLDGIGPSTGPAAVVGVKLLLDRLDGLAKSKAPADHAAVKTLAARGIGDDQRKRLRGLVEIAEKGTAATAPDPTEAARAAKAAERQAALRDLRSWYDDWADMARASIKRRDRLILLGLAKRRSPRKAAPAPAPAKVAT